jgi:hypothetical protein
MPIIVFLNVTHSQVDKSYLTPTRYNLNLHMMCVLNTNVQCNVYVYICVHAPKL